MHKPLHLPMGSTHTPTAFSYTRCTDQHSFPNCLSRRLCTHADSPVVPCSLGVRSRKCTSHFTNPWGTLTRKRHFCTAAVRISTAPRRRTPYLSNRLCTHLGHSRSALYSRCTILKMRKLLHQPMGSTHTQLAFSYTRCTRISTDSRRRTPYLSHRFCTHSGQSRSALYSRCTILKMHKPLLQPMGSTHTETSFLYNCCTDLYWSPKVDALPQP